MADYFENLYETTLDELATANARIEELVEVLRRYVLYNSLFGEEALMEEFPCEFSGSSAALERWLDDVLRKPAAAALADAGSMEAGDA